MVKIKDNHQATGYSETIPKELEHIINPTRLSGSKLNELLNVIANGHSQNSIPKGICNTNRVSEEVYKRRHPLAVKKGSWYQIGVQRCYPMSYSYKPFGEKILDFDPDLGEFIWYSKLEWRSNNFIKNINNANWNPVSKGNTMPSLMQYIPMGTELEYVSRNGTINSMQCEECADHDEFELGASEPQTYCYDGETCAEDGEYSRSMTENERIEWEEKSFKFLAELNLSFGAVGTQAERVWIAKDDSTVDVEFVSAPMTLRAYKAGFAIAEHLFNTFEEYSKVAKGYYGPCGAHIHIDKLTIDNPYQYYAFLSMHYENPELIAEVAQRSVDSGSQWCYLYKPDEVARFAYYKSPSASRGAVAVKHDTVELRYFRSNLKPERILKNLEFTQALYQFVTQLSYQDMARDGNHKAKWFLLWIRAYRNTYSNLYSFLNMRGWLDEKYWNGNEDMEEI